VRVRARPLHGPACKNQLHGTGPWCADHGCVRCGDTILADYEDARLCGECGSKRGFIEAEDGRIAESGLVERRQKNKAPSVERTALGWLWRRPAGTPRS